MRKVSLGLREGATQHKRTQPNPNRLMRSNRELDAEIRRGLFQNCAWEASINHTLGNG